MNIGKLVRVVGRFSTQMLRTQVFHCMDNQTIATPELVKKALITRIPFHSRLSQIGLYHGKRTRHAIRSCFSEKK